MVVKHQAHIPITTRKYKRNILCDIVPMQIGHIILRRPWQYDRNFFHDGHSNKITFSFQGTKFILCPSTPQHVRDNEIKLKAKLDSENENEKKIVY